MSDQKTINIGLLDVYARMDGGIEVLQAIDRVAAPVLDKKGLERMKEAAVVITAWADKFPPDQAAGIKEALGFSMRRAVEQFKRKREQHAAAE
jgi:hypothetical protein